MFFGKQLENSVDPDQLASSGPPVYAICKSQSNKHLGCLDICSAIVTCTFTKSNFFKNPATRTLTS